MLSYTDWQEGYMMPSKQSASVLSESPRIFHSPLFFFDSKVLVFFGWLDRFFFCLLCTPSGISPDSVRVRAPIWGFVVFVIYIGVEDVRKPVLPFVNQGSPLLLLICLQFRFPKKNYAIDFSSVGYKFMS